MTLFARLRHHLFPITLPDTSEQDRMDAVANDDAATQQQRAIDLMERWNPERAEDLRRIARTGNFIEGWLTPENGERP